MSATLSKQHWGLHGGMAPDHCNNDEPGNVSCVGQHACTGGNPMTERNYACDGPIRLFFGNHTAVDLAATGEAAFKGQLCVPTSLRARAPLKCRLPPLTGALCLTPPTATIRRCVVRATKPAC